MRSGDPPITDIVLRSDALVGWVSQPEIYLLPQAEVCSARIVRFELAEPPLLLRTLASLQIQINATFPQKSHFPLTVLYVIGEVPKIS